MRTPISNAVAVILAALVLIQGARVVPDSLRAPADEAADALPLFLATVTMAEGGDPGDRLALRASYEARGLRARAATYSTLYPATLPALLRPVAGLDWPAFVHLWRGVLLAALLACGALGLCVMPLARWARPMALPLGLALVLALPVSAECVRLGQANMLLALLITVAMACVARRWDAWAGGALALGVAVKLVPGLLVIPLLAARRWRALLAATLVGLAILGLALASLPAERLVHGVVQTVRFQAAIQPDWAARHAHPAGWLAFLASLRHGPLLLLSLALGLPAAAIAPRRSVLVTVLALFSAWLGCSAAAFHALYLPLLYPALLHLVAWPLERDAPLRWAVPSASLALLATAAAFFIEPQGVVLEARMSLLGMLVWGLCVLRLAVAWRGVELPSHGLVGRLTAHYPAALALLLGVLLARALPQTRPLAPPEPPALQQEIEVGFIRAGDPAPGPSDQGPSGAPSTVLRRTGRWPGVVVGSTLLPGSHGAAARHLELSRQTWSALESDQALGPWAHWVLEVLPSEALHEQLAADTLRAVVREGLALDAWQDELRLVTLRSSHDELMAGEGTSARGRRSLGHGASP